MALPFVLLIVLFHSEKWERMVAGFGPATASLALVNLVALGPGSFIRWAHALFSYSRDIRGQPEIASLASTYVHLVSPPLRTGLEVTSLTVAAALTAWWWWAHRSTRVTMLDTGWLWRVWFLAVPYAHINDVVMLTPPIVAVLGPNARRASWPLGVLALYLSSLEVAVASLHLEPPALLAAGACLVIAPRRPAYRNRAGPARHPDIPQPMVGQAG